MALIVDDTQPPERKSTSVAKLCAEDSAHLIDADDLALAHQLLSTALAYGNDVAFMEYWNAQSNEMKIAIWCLWDSKQRSAIKRMIELWVDYHGQG